MRNSRSDRRTALWVLGVMFVLIVAVAALAPNSSDEDPQPSTYNSGAHGWKGAYLLLKQLGYQVRRTETSAAETLNSSDAPHTTYLLADPHAPAEDVQRQEYEAIEHFLQRGGRVIATGYQGALFLPGGRAGGSTQMLGELCNSQPEGNSVFARAGSVSTYASAPWTAVEPLVRVDARCGSDAVLVHRDYAKGGRMIYLSSSEPFSNRGLRQDNALALLLIAVGPASGQGKRIILFDEFYHGVPASPSEYLKGLPIRSLEVQAALLLLLLMFSYTRRSGPIREPLQLPRTSPLEFARNMGALYERAGASQAATEAAQRQLMNELSDRFGLPNDTAKGSAHGIAAYIANRTGFDGEPLLHLLERLQSARYETLRPRDALQLVRAMHAESNRLRAAASQRELRDSEEMK